jgi:uncharacterized protein YgiM (DUF1202 family)
MEKAQDKAGKLLLQTDMKRTEYLIKTIRKLLYLLFFAACVSHAQSGDPLSMGMAAMKAGDYAEAYCLWRPLAMRGDSEAAYHLGWLYANGNGLRVDIPKAIYWWGQAANRQHKEAMFALALAYTNGEKIKRDEDEAIRWFLKAANSGHEEAREILIKKIREQDRSVVPYLAEILKQAWAGFEVEISAEKVNLRQGPGIDKPTLGQGLQGERLFVVHQQGKWLQAIRPGSLESVWVAAWLTDPRFDQ